MAPLTEMFVIHLLSVIRPTASFPEDVYKSEYKWIEKGDINIGAILSIHSPNSLLNCTSDIQDMRNVQNVEALSFAVQEINDKHSDLLPNLKLGFAILDDCLSPSIALARAIQFMPSSVRLRDMCYDSTETCEQVGNTDNADFFDVVGVIGTYTSKLSIVVADVLNLFRIPQISHTATSNVLSDKTRFPYFFRMVPPDRYQVMVMVSLLRRFNWTHVSIVYSEGSYGREGVKELGNILHQGGNRQICIEDTLEILYNSGDRDLDRIIQKLNRQTDTLVVIAFVEIEDAVLLSHAVRRSGLMDRFVWIGSDSFSLVLKESPKACRHLAGSFTVEPNSRNIERFAEHMAYIQTEKGRRENKNPWLREITAKKVSSLSENNVSHRMTGGTWTLPEDDDEYIHSSFVDTFLIDSVYAFAYALNNVVRKHCNEWQLRPAEDLSHCIRRVGIFHELKHINFNGSFGKLEFNENGDIMTKYLIRQCQSMNSIDTLQQIGFWDMGDEHLDIDIPSLSWPGDRLPVSACPEPCTGIPGTIYYFAKQTCCWECVTCKPNEIVTTNATRCEECPELQWPDGHRVRCDTITPVHFGMTNAITVGLCTAAVAGILFCMWISAVLFKHRDEHVVKCTSLELSSMIIIGAVLTFALTGSFLTQPNSIKCYINQVGFSLVFTIIYAPLLVKTNRIYRIFNAGRRTTRKPCCISKSSQVLISLILIFLQVAIVIITTSLEPPELRLQMPSKTEKLVELFCYLPRAGLLSSLSYNLILVLFCTFYAFKTRKLPDNYKESRYIAYCVDTTLLIWITFLPTYFTTSRAAAKLTILAASLLLNASVTIACLFIPRVYSLYKTLRNPCVSNGHHYKDFRIVKHVVKRKRSFVEVVQEDSLPRVMSSAATIASDIVVKENDDVISLTTAAPIEISSMLKQCRSTTLEETDT